MIATAGYDNRLLRENIAIESVEVTHRRVATGARERTLAP